MFQGGEGRFLNVPVGEGRFMYVSGRRR